MMYSSLSFYSLLAMWLLGLVFAYPSNASPFSPSSWPLPHNITGDPNGWGGIHVHDPCVIKYNDSYYSFSTHDLVAMGKAPSLSGPWEHYGSVLSTDSIINLPGRNDTWGPDVIQYNGMFYCFYSVSTFGTQTSAIGVATSETLEPGFWIDHGQVIRSGNDTGVIPYNITNAIDPAVIIDPADGTAYLNYGSFFGDIWQLILTPDLLSVPTASSAVQVSIDPAGTRPEEGGFMSYHERWYYLWFSHGICCGFNASDLPPAGQEYSIRVGRSQSARGPFVDINGTVLDNGGGNIVYGSHSYVYAPGGQGVLIGEGGDRDVLYYHYRKSSCLVARNMKNCLRLHTVNKDVSYVDETTLLGWDYIEYVDGWPVLVYE